MSGGPLEKVVQGGQAQMIDDDLERLADLVDHVRLKCRCIDCEYGMVPNCYGVYCRCLARYMEPDGFCSLAKRRGDR